MLLAILSYVLGALFLLLLVLFVLLCYYSPGKTLPHPTGQTGVAEIATLEIGGVKQSMILRGENKQNPVLLFLHGGPGSPEYVFARNFPQVGLEKEFTVCWWDQRGAGMSYHSSIPPESMTVQQMIEDTIQVAHYLQQRFGQQKIYLAGHSWGTYLGMHAIAAQPALFAAYIGIGQVASQFESEQLAQQFMIQQAAAAKNKKLEQKLRQFTLSTPGDITPAYLQLRSATMNQLGIGLTHKKSSMLKDIVIPLFTCKEYTLKAKWGYFAGMAFSIHHLFDAVLTKNLSTAIPSVQVPVYIAQGAFDYQVSFQKAQEYYHSLQAPDKEFYIFENSAHTPFIEEPERFHAILKEIKARTMAQQ